jgi:hypothetical protein
MRSPWLHAIGSELGVDMSCHTYGLLCGQEDLIGLDVETSSLKNIFII